MGLVRRATQLAARGSFGSVASWICRRNDERAAVGDFVRRGWHQVGRPTAVGRPLPPAALAVRQPPDCDAAIRSAGRPGPPATVAATGDCDIGRSSRQRHRCVFVPCLRVCLCCICNSRRVLSGAADPFDVPNRPPPDELQCSRPTAIFFGRARCDDVGTHTAADVGLDASSLVQSTAPQAASAAAASRAAVSPERVGAVCSDPPSPN